jgi:hypothetical protein
LKEGGKGKKRKKENNERAIWGEQEAGAGCKRSIHGGNRDLDEKKKKKKKRERERWAILPFDTYLKEPR